MPGRRPPASFGGSHTFADDGVYTVTVRSSTTTAGRMFETSRSRYRTSPRALTVTPLARRRALKVSESVLPATFSDPGFDNPLNMAPGLNGGPSETSESFTYSIDWGDQPRRRQSARRRGYSTACLALLPRARSAVVTLTRTTASTRLRSRSATTTVAQRLTNYAITVMNVAPMLGGYALDRWKLRRPADQLRSDVRRSRLR